MGVVSEIRLKDNYTPTAKKVAQSASKMGRSLNKVARESKKMGGALKTSLDRSYEVKIKNIQSKKIQRDIRSMQSQLRKATDENYQVKITTNESVRSKFNRTFDNIRIQAKKTGASISSAFSRIKLNTTSFVKAQFEARRLQRELKRTTGKRHKVRIKLNGENLGILDTIKAKLKSLTSKTHNVVVDTAGKVGGAIKGALGGAARMAAKVGGIGAGIITGVGIKGATERMDTMDTFQRSLTLMTGDASVANKTLDQLNSISRGTAYGVDTMAQATQGFVTSGVDVNKAVSSVKNWGDAVAVYGDGTNESLSSVMYQMNQMSAVGKASLEDIRPAMERGIPVLQIYADATGKSVEEVSDALSKGEISAEEFMTTMDKAFTEGTSKFPALNGAAKEAGTTWAATLSNMKAAITRGFVDLMEGIDDVLGSAGLPTMKEMVAGFGMSIESGLGSMAGGVAAMQDAGIFDDLAGVFSAIKEAVMPVVPAFAELGSAALPLLSGGLNLLSAVITNLVAPGLSMLGSFASNIVAPALEAIGSVINSFVVPALDRIGSFITSTVVPAFDSLATLVGGSVRSAFDALKTAVNSVKNAFNKVKGAVDSAVGALKGIGGKISGAISGFFSGISLPGHAGGTSYFQGGVTRINEVGDEAWKLPKGTKIYPSGKTSKMIKNDINRNTTNREGDRINHFNNNFYIYGGDVHKKREIADEITKELRRLAVTV